jgi:hypothetical protein
LEGTIKILNIFGMTIKKKMHLTLTRRQQHMRKQLFLFLATIAILFNTAALPKNAGKKPDYVTFKDSVKKEKSRYINHSTKEISGYLFKLINNDIYEYWQGTPWDFYGKTQTPKVGTIACGYFVTNTLADLGFKINRIKLAEVASGDMIKVLCTEIRSFRDFKKFQAYLDLQPKNAIFIVGLDFHTGYIVKDGTKSYFMHSNYIKKQGVIKELVQQSQALNSNKFFMIGSLTANRELLNKWVNE